MIRILLQWIMGGTMTSAFIAHDYYYFNNYLTLSLASAAFLLALVWFHILIFLKHARMIEYATETGKKIVAKLRIFLIGIPAALCLWDCIRIIFLVGAPAGVKAELIGASFASIILIAIPELVFKAIFSFKTPDKTS